MKATTESILEGLKEEIIALRKEMREILNENKMLRKEVKELKNKPDTHEEKK